MMSAHHVIPMTKLKTKKVAIVVIEKKMAERSNSVPKNFGTNLHAIFEDPF